MSRRQLAGSSRESRSARCTVSSRARGLASSNIKPVAWSIPSSRSTTVSASPRALLDTVHRALRLYRDEPASWRRLIQNGMGRDYSWEQSAKAYLALYQQALGYAKTAEIA